MVHTGRQLHNDERDLESISDGYESKLQELGTRWLAYAIQKDAIQNSWDARLPQNGEWRIEFQIVNTSKGEFLVITDQGTTGLVGSLWDTEEEQITLLSGEDSDENLAFFLSSNFSNKTNISGGKRGRGKSLFLVASKNKAFFFESLRADGIRVFGGQYIATVSKSIEYALTQEKEYINDIVDHDLGPLNKPGTRVFIKNPHRGLVESVSNGTLMDYIEKTWWEIVKKYQANIEILSHKTRTIAQVPDYYRDDLLSKQPDLTVKEYPNLHIDAGGESYKIKRIKLVYDPSGEIPDDIRGIAIQRNGMTIERRPAEQLVKEEGMQKVYGWVEMEPDLEKSMYDLEDVEHLGFNWIKNPASKLRTEITMKARDFAREVKIIESELSKQHNLHKKAEDSVANRINKYLSTLGFRGFSPGRGPIKPHTRVEDLPLRVSIAGFSTPNATKRVDYGNHIKATAQAINELNLPLNLKMKVWLVSKEGNTTRSLERDLILLPNETFDLGWEEIEITKEEFSRGEYSFRAKLILMDDTNITLPRIGLLEKGNDQIKSSTSFCVDQDPKQSGFLKFVATPKSTYLESYREDDEIVIEYGTAHPYISEFMDPSKEPEFERFLMQNGIILALNEVLAEDMASDTPKVFKDLGTDKIEPTDILPTIMQYASKFLGS
jgi:hypothetical protein